jgi:DNA-binding protein HU-beta
MSLTQSQLIEELTSQLEAVSKKQVKTLLGALTAIAYREAKNGFTIPGLGKLVLVHRKARMGRNPATGESIKIPAKTVLKFRIAKAAKEAANGPVKKPAKTAVVKKTVAKKVVPAAKKIVKKAAKKK